MFKLNPAPTFKAKVEISEPGIEQTHPITLVFRHMPSSQIDNWIEKTRTQEVTAESRSDIKALLEVVVGWEEVCDDESPDIPFTPDSFTRLIENFPASPHEIIRAYIFEIGRSRAKN